ncbi:signal recognition particle subunit SRP68 [Octopus bimaculoides]|uniref:Signal recognition particle subunit SRP68 n=1 Tax=Octopus bimaculoides TaxID=37653 RepID=A0A0L8FIQ5_OCTBM|nr:signal recognition particle subunit SRP68 [Octopus bimaculoides]|eukprot:XP_014789465.1 PREDICTED: signal recognition particle subunit SRP68-like [Octopus bimaculoides]
MAQSSNAAGDSSHEHSESRKDHRTSASTSFTLEILQIIKEAQQQHGLRHGDYQRYRSYCSRRLRRIRKSLHFPQGSKHKVVSKKITNDMLVDIRYLHLPLFSAERAWGYFMQLKAEANTEHRKQFHMLSRLKKAVNHADDLAKLCGSTKCDARTKLEAQGYQAWMKGTLEFELERWANAIEFYTNSETIYSKLASAFTDETKDLYLQRVSEVAPNIRYCSFRIGDESAIKDLMRMRLESGQDAQLAHLDQLLSQTREKQAATLSNVTWRNRTVPVKNEQVRVFLLNLQESAKQVETAEGFDRKVSIIESLLKQCIDALQVLRDALQDDQNFKAALRGQTIEVRISNQHYLHSYLTYIRLTKTIERNLLLIENLKQYLPNKTIPDGKKVTKPQDLVRLYDIIIQNLNEIFNLAGIEDDMKLSNEVKTLIQSFKSFRTFYIALSYSMDKKWKESIALYEKVLHYIALALDGYNGLQSSGIFLNIQNEKMKIEELEKEASCMRDSCHASSILGNTGITEPVKTVSNKKLLMERLEQYFEDPSLVSKHPKLVTFPPEFEPIPCRPLFFDLALNHISFPSLDGKIEQKTGGIRELMKGWLWGGSKK